ncbi:MAG: hypothetical protein IH598_03660 [Bacteroidales bacterium]|nr:hypothetical protein [Bacteroidales bacterium]
MFKKITLLAVAAIFIAACGNAPEKPKDEAEVAEIPEVTVDDFWATPDEYVGKEVAMQGVVVHVCKEGGKRMFIVGENPDDRLQIKAGDDISAFAVELEGSMVEVKGVLDELRIDEAYLQNWENELRADNPESEMKIHRGEEGHEHGEEDVQYEWDQIANYREMLAETEDDHLSFYSLIASSFVEIK